MADEQDRSKFNVNTILSFKNKERDKNLSIGAYNGNVQFTFGNATFERGNRPRSAILNPNMLYCVVEMLEDLIANPEPGKKKTLIFKGLWNAEARRKELSLVMTIGMDDNATCYIGLKHTNKEKEVFSARFELCGDRDIEVAGSYDDDKSRSFSTLKMLHMYLHQAILSFAAIMTRNHLIKPNFQRNNNSGGNRAAAAPAPDTDDDF